ncbi:MAG: thioredoxin domain-containing protein [Planctomycetes bacterium]|nr:thioredoxin domain-containing protein [Planctomycetota bacterium]
MRTNRLAAETSPYLLQHAKNPVDWHPWGPAAFALARETQRPIFLSIGYSACHWCHVMERESFEDEETARVLNESFVCIKVDREERPDVDDVYMRAVMSMGKHGGWPLSVWLTPDGEPFYGGTYFPPDERPGLPSFRRVLLHLAHLWNTQRDELREDARALTDHLRVRDEASATAWPGAALEQAVAGWQRRFDPRDGGFGGAPKFPQPSTLRALVRAVERGVPEARGMLELSLQRMALGGIHDHLSGGFHRYSVDALWLVPHFEKMLYDNALLARVYLEAWAATGDAESLRAAEATLGYLRREMLDPTGGFHSATDADSEGEEGRFFVWTPEALIAELGAADGAFFAEVYGVEPNGNFEHGTSVLHLQRTLDEEARARGAEPEAFRERLRALRAKLYAARARRVPPAKDDKILADWNGLAIAAFATAYRATGAAHDLAAARNASEFLFRELFTGPRWKRSWRAGKAQHHALLSDHAYVLEGLLALFQVDPSRRTLERAIQVAERMLERFEDREHGGFFATPSDGEQLIARFKDDHDGATPSPTAVAAQGLAQLYQITGEERFRSAAERTLVLASTSAAETPELHASLLLAAEWLAPSATTIVVSEGRGRAELLAVARESAPAITLTLAPHAGEKLEDLAPLLASKGSAPDGSARAYLCRGFTCLEPVGDPARLRELRAR